VKKVYVLFSMMCLVLLCAAAYAAEPQSGQTPQAAKETKETNETTLAEVVVTATKTPVDQSKVTQKVDIITNEEIQNLTFTNRNISEIFRYQPGTFVNPLSRNDANWGSYGGLGPKYSVYMLDGLPIDSFVDPMSLDPIYLERAEVHRGPASVLYPNYMSMDFSGNQSSLSGISNLITKERITQPMTSIIGGYGSWNTALGQFYHQGFKNDFHYFMGVSYERSDYYNYGTTPSWLNMRNRPDYDKAKVYGKGTWFIDANQKIALFANTTIHVGDVGRPNREYDHRYSLLNFSYENKLSQAFTLNVKAGYRYYHRSWEEDNYPPRLSLRENDGVIQNILPVDVSVSYKHLKESVLTVGTDMQYATYETYSEPDGGGRSTGNDMTSRSHGLYAQEQLVLGPWVLRAGGRLAYTRHDYEKLGGATPGLSANDWLKPLWSAGVRYNFSKKAGVYANAGSSYVTPDGKAVGGTLKWSDLGVIGRNGQLPNPDLKPESGIGIDVGADAWALNNLKVSIRGFYNIVDDAITTVVVNTNPSQSRAINAGQAKSMGVEFDMKHMINKYIGWFANATYTHSEVSESLNPNEVGAELSFVPRWLANVGLTARLPYQFTVSPYVQYVGVYYDGIDKTGRNKFGDFGLVNLKILKPLYKIQGYMLNASLDVNNLFNRRYVMPWGFRDPGINALAKLELRF